MDHRKLSRIFDTANLRSSKTGVPRTIFVSFMTEGHRPRIKLAVEENLLEGKTIDISIEDTPRVIAGDTNEVPSNVLNKAHEWVRMNKDLLLQYWEGEIDTVEFVQGFSKV